MAPTNAKSPIKSTGSRPAAHNQKKSTRVRSGAITPIIKIVHVYAPTLVRTDVANFRALVQEMTGNEAASHNIKDINTVGSAERESTDESMSRKLDKLGAKSRTSNCGGARHREDACSNSSEARAAGEVCTGRMESPGKSWESSCEQSVDSYFAEESEEGGCVDDHLYKMQQTYCSAYFATSTWRQDIPGGFESFDCF